MKKLSVGVIITNGINFLSIHPTNTMNFDIPKGMAEKGENTIDTAIREVYEETGIDLNEYRNCLQPIGYFHYNDVKDIFVYLLILDKLPDVNTMKCISTFHYTQYILLPEVDNFIYKSIYDLSSFKQPMQIILNKVFDIL